MPPNTTPVSSPTTDGPQQEFPPSNSPNQGQGHGRAITKSNAIEPIGNFGLSEYRVEEGVSRETSFPEYLPVHAGYSTGDNSRTRRPQLLIANQPSYEFHNPQESSSGYTTNKQYDTDYGSRIVPGIGSKPEQPRYPVPLTTNGAHSNMFNNIVPDNATATNRMSRMYPSPPMDHLAAAVNNMSFSDNFGNSPHLYNRPGYRFSNAGSHPVAPNFHNKGVHLDQQPLAQRSPRKNSWPATTGPQPIGAKERRPAVNEEADSDEEDDPLHPNKFPTVFEFHTRKECGYKRQSTKSGDKEKQVSEKVYIPHTGQHEIQHKTIRYYQKDLVRYCICGKYEDKSYLIEMGRNNDCKGYEIHYSRKCKWKGYTDFETKQRVIIRLCKCYKPT